jgi:hypothetical protein
MRCFPREILAEIFLEARAGSEMGDHASCTEVTLNCMMVCQHWNVSDLVNVNHQWNNVRTDSKPSQTIASTIFYSSIILTGTWRRLLKFKAFLQAPRRQSQITTLVRSITIAFSTYRYRQNEDHHTFVQALCDVVHLLPNLNSFRIDGFYDCALVVAAVTEPTAAPPPLTSLDVEIHGDQTGAFQVIGSLQQLDSLAIRVNTVPRSGKRDVWLHRVGDRIVIPSVRKMTWQVELWNSVIEEALLLMAACRFGAGCSLFLDIGFDGSRWNEEHAALIGNIIQSYEPSHLTLEYFRRGVLAILAPIVARIHSVTIRWGNPPPELFIQGVVPRKLALYLDYKCDARSCNDFIHLLASLDKVTSWSEGQHYLLLDIALDRVEMRVEPDLDSLIWTHVGSVTSRLRLQNVNVECLYYIAHSQRWYEL